MMDKKEYLVLKQTKYLGVLRKVGETIMAPEADMAEHLQMGTMILAADQKGIERAKKELAKAYKVMEMPAQSEELADLKLHLAEVEQAHLVEVQGLKKALKDMEAAIELKDVQLAEMTEVVAQKNLELAQVIEGSNQAIESAQNTLNQVEMESQELVKQNEDLKKKLKAVDKKAAQE